MEKKWNKTERREEAEEKKNRMIVNAFNHDISTKQKYGLFVIFVFVSFLLLLLLYWLLLFVGLVSVTDSLIPVVNWFLFYFINISLLHKIYCI